jgi:dTDP-glucose 4,6-dehydratase
MKILIYGANGWIGSQITKYLNENKFEYLAGTARVDDVDALDKEILQIKPTHVLSLIGRTHGKIGDKTYTTIDYLEQKGKLTENVRDNLFSPMVLAVICSKYNIHFSYLGTGCIFEFDENHPFGQMCSSDKSNYGFTEDSKPNFFGSSYSVVKGFTDRLMHLYPNVLNLRIRMPINAENNGRNFITKITNYEKICSVPNSMTVLPELIPFAIDLMKRSYTGTVNLTNPGLITHNEILSLYKEIVDPSFEWCNFTIEEQNTILASGRSNNYLSTELLESLYPDVPNIRDAVIECLKSYPKNVKIPRLDKKITASELTESELTKFVNTLDTNILVTGGCGFIGSHFINHMYDKYDKINIINLDAMYYCASESNVRSDIRESNRYKFIKGNICSLDLVQHILSEYKISHVVHFAAQSHVQNSFSDALQYTQDNVLGTHTLLEACRIHNKTNKINRFIHVSTDEVYGESMIDKDEHKTEFSVLCPTNPYAGTKAGAELIAQTYHHSFGLPIIITRGNNVYGPNQYPEKLIPKFIQLLKNNQKVTIQGNGSALRAFLHVSDTANAFDIILSKGEIGQIYNIGCDSNMEYSVMDVAKLLIKFIQNTTDYDKWTEYIEDRPFNDARYYISNHKLKDLGWEIKIDFLQGLRSLAE